MITDDREEDRLDRALTRVLAAELCSGCGACTALDGGLAMVEDARGYLRPIRRASGRAREGAAELFRKSCPGVTVTANRERDARPHETMGSYVAVWRAWASDEETRFRGSSGGALTALSEWLIASGEAIRVAGAAAASDPRRSVPVTIMSREEALAAAGSRYTPVATLSNPELFHAGSAMVGKPCEASAFSALTNLQTDAASAPSAPSGRPLILSFFCAGTPSAKATDRLLEELGVAPEVPVEELWYRGRGWPGRFTALTREAEVSADYEESWGRTLGPTTQWRCKVCPDGVGESADVVAADHWDVDERGYPSFTEGAGASALIARTRRGREAVLRAAAAGVIHLEEVSMESLAAVQPLQRKRRSFLAARLLGSRFAGRSIPRYRGFGLLRLAARNPRESLRVARGAFVRVRGSRQA